MSVSQLRRIRFLRLRLHLKTDAYHKGGLRTEHDDMSGVGEEFLDLTPGGFDRPRTCVLPVREPSQVTSYFPATCYVHFSCQGGSSVSADKFYSREGS